MKAPIRVPIMGIALGIALIFGVVFFFAGHASPTDAANQFMMALASGDDAKLTKVTYLRSGTTAELEKEYEFSTKEAGKYYSFTWRVKDEKIADDKTAAVQLSVIRNVRNPGAYEENFEIPCIKQDGEWKVDVAAISPQLYPALPRG